MIGDPGGEPWLDAPPPTAGQAPDGAALVDLERWGRASHAGFFQRFTDPHFNVVAEVSLGPMLEVAAARGSSAFIAMLYATTRAANELYALRLRLREGVVVLHPRVHPSFTLRVDAEHFNYCGADYNDDYATFEQGVRAAIDQKRGDRSLRAEAEARDDLLFVSSLPWLRFTSIQHAAMDPRRDSFPRITWGRFTPTAAGTVAPLSLQGHHALMDGIHTAMFFRRVEVLAAAPDWLRPA